MLGKHFFFLKNVTSFQYSQQFACRAHTDGIGYTRAYPICVCPTQANCIPNLTTPTMFTMRLLKQNLNEIILLAKTIHEQNFSQTQINTETCY